MIAKLQLIHETTGRRHLNHWLNSEKLAPANSGSDSHLSEEKKTAELVIYLTNNLLPTIQAIIEQVIDWWGSCIQHVDIGVKYNFCRNKLWQLST